MTKSAKKPPLPGSYWLEEGKILCGRYPGGFLEKETRKNIRLLLEAGIRVFVDLTTEDDGLRPYEGIMADEALSLEVEAQRLSFSIGDLDVPDPARMSMILSAIEDELERRHPVYLHCLGGVGRTGTAAACWLVRNGMSAENALAEVNRLYHGAAGSSDWLHSPETKEQVKFVHRWERFFR